MENWKTELFVYGQSLGQVNMKRGICQGDSLSPLLFVLCMIPLTLLLRQTKAGYQFKGRHEKINQLLYIDDLKLCGKDEAQIDSLFKSVYMFSTDIGMEFGLTKCGFIILTRGKIVKNSWAVALLRYGAGVMTWRRHELQGMDRKTRKLLTMYDAFHPKSDVDRPYLPRAMGGRGLISWEGCVTLEEINLGWYISTESLLVQVRNSKIVDAASSVDKTDYKRNKINAGEQRWKNKKMYGQFCRDVN